MPVWLTLAAALLAVIVVVIVGQQVVAPQRPLLANANFAPEAITPNADGDTDVTLFSYTLSRNAQIWLSLEAADGTTYFFRENQPRIPGDYRVAFSGVVDGFRLPDDNFEGEVLRRLIPDGAYTWRLRAVADDDGESAELTGTLTISDGDSPLPLLPEFTVFPQAFTPNQDGINDRTQINVFLSKDADLDVYLQPEDGPPIFIMERQDVARPGEAGRHSYDFDGGVDLGADPPPDGTYTVVAFARDAVGQEIQRTAELTLTDGGKPLAQILAQPSGATVVFEGRPYEPRFFTDSEQIGERVEPPTDPGAFSLTTLTLPLGDLLVFMLVVENYSDVPIRTTGPEPGTVYEWEQRAATLDWLEESGAWRVGIDCQAAPYDYPWRWALGTDETLTQVEDPDTGNIYRYLPAGGRSVVWGAVRMTEITSRNPQACWAGLIHEDVEISLRNRNVGARQIELVDVAE
ncbi:MAG: hypothetical protein GYB67_08215 [Chloroflexi bacterium]|nr:hypothetical protein [Chloroflexota bacterium]